MDNDSNDRDDNEQARRNYILIWDINRNIRYARLRADWFDTASRFSALLTTVSGSAAFASFAGDWPILGMIFSGIVAFFTSVCHHFDYAKNAELFRDRADAYEDLLAEVMAAGGYAMFEKSWHRHVKAYHRTDRLPGGGPLARRPLLMKACENAVAKYDMCEPIPPPNEIPGWSVIIRQIWPWAWPAKERVTASGEASAEK